MNCYHFLRTRAAHLALSLLLVLSLAATVQAQDPRIVNVPQGVGTLNETIEGDTTATGDRVDLNTVYVLERGGFYLTTGEIENRFPLTIVAAEGDGARPVVQPAVVGGGSSSQPFTPRSHLTLRGLYVTNLDELGGLNQRIIRVRQDSAVITIDDCHLDKSGQSAFRLDNSWITVNITNSVISNIGQAASLDNGRGVDTRGNDVERIHIENSTFYNLTSRIIRDGGGFIKHHVFNHNTVVNVAQHLTTPGEVQNLSFTNNLIVNGGFLGANANRFEGRVWIGIDSLATDSLGQPLRDGPQVINVRNNRIVVDPAIVEAYGDSVFNLPFASSAGLALINAAGTLATNAIDTVAFSFVNAPEPPTNLLQQRWEGVPEENLPDMDDGGGAPDGVQLPFDFAYSTDSPAYTASTAGQPQGDLNWFGIQIIPTASEAEEAVPDAFTLRGNYPNPFNPSTTVLFDLTAPAEVTLVVYDLMGRQVLQVDAGHMTAGQARSVRLDAAGLASGIYVYQVRAESQHRTLTGSGRMVLLR